MGTNAHECAHLRSSPEKLFVMYERLFISLFLIVPRLYVSRSSGRLRCWLRYEASEGGVFLAEELVSISGSGGCWAGNPEGRLCRGAARCLKFGRRLRRRV
ncbi:hypothetical protein P171DRAFT_249491 [Karstenula rhodostoma CBS 690.94]|uniref:Uncharacterized protein n=1 Tax=Karstenula rhodostoma CBS 690.94 TaxID=1392251 RepID=A0A9P4PNK7_9PLEO|nr:hypothetical protein P171DRAFT_249491 [Karstenula rhodostoma CBS 690.94]